MGAMAVPGKHRAHGALLQEPKRWSARSVTCQANLPAARDNGALYRKSPP